MHEELKNPRIILGKYLPSAINRKTRQKDHKDIEDLNNSVNHHELVFIEH